MYRGDGDHFLEHSCACKQKSDNGPERSSFVFCGSRFHGFLRRSLSTSRQSVNFFVLRISFIIGLLAREIFPGCQNYYDFVSIFSLKNVFVIV